jgi:hypothetical protein
MEIKGSVSSLEALKFNIYEQPKEILTKLDLVKIHLGSLKHIPNIKHNYVKFDYIELFFTNDRKFKRSVKNTLFTKIHKINDMTVVKLFDNHAILLVDKILPEGYCEIPADYNNYEIYVEFEGE